jgi:hypothetical protein
MTVAISALRGCKEKTREVPVIPVEYSDTKNFLDVMADKRHTFFWMTNLWMLPSVKYTR